MGSLELVEKGAGALVTALAEFMIVTEYFNGESVRLDGGIRMAPR